MLNQQLRLDQHWALYADHASLYHPPYKHKLQGDLS